MNEALSNLNDFLKPNLKKILLSIPSAISLTYFYGIIFNIDYIEFMFSLPNYADILALADKMTIMLLAYFISCSILKMHLKNEGGGRFLVKAMIFIAIWAVLPIILYIIITAYTNFAYDMGGGYPYEMTAQDRSCKTSDDCQLISTACCSGCGQDSSALNKKTSKKIDDWKENNCKPCIAIADCLRDEHWSPFCLNNACKIVKTPLIDYTEEFFNRTPSITDFANAFRESNQDHNFTDDQIKSLYDCRLNHDRADPLKCAKIY